MRMRAFGAAIAGLSGPKGGVARRRTTAIASKEYLDGQAEGETRHYSRVDGTYARETTDRPAGAGFCKSRDPTAQPAAQPPNGSRRDYGMAAVTHRTTLICGMRLPGGCECVLGCQWRKAAVRKRTGSSCAGLCTRT